MLDPIAKVLGKLLFFIYNIPFINNYGVAIIIFTIIVKMFLLPLTLKQLKSAAKMQEVQPLIAEIQKKYKNDRDTLGKETMRIYQENKINPASGCLPLLIQMPILFSLFFVVSQPLKLLLGKSEDTVKKIVDVVGGLTKNSSHHITNDLAYSQIESLKYLNDNINNSEIMSKVSQYIKPSEIINMDFLGLNLGVIPTLDTSKLFGPNMFYYWALLIIPVIAVISTYYSTKISMVGNPASASNPTMKYMLYFGPVMTLVFSFQIPLGVIVYWTTGYLFQIVQQIFINKYKSEVQTK